MTITKTSNGSYRLKLYVPTEARPSLGISGHYYDKRFKTKKEAKEAELQILIDINTIQKGVHYHIKQSMAIFSSKIFIIMSGGKPIKQVKRLQQINHPLFQQLTIQKLFLDYIFYQYLEIIPLNF